MPTTKSDKSLPANWQIDPDFEPAVMQLKGRDYMNVQNRLLWFIKDQRRFIADGLATTAFVIETKLVEHDIQRQFAQFSTYVRDVLGNESTMYGSEAQKDFSDYLEKASTKSLGRALLALGYGTAFAPEMDEGERVVDAPLSPRKAPPSQPQTSRERASAQTTIPVHPNDGGGVPALSFDLDHLPLGTRPQTLADFAKSRGLDRPAWEALWKKHNGALPAMWKELYAMFHAPVRE